MPTTLLRWFRFLRPAAARPSPAAVPAYAPPTDVRSAFALAVQCAGRRALPLAQAALESRQAARRMAGLFVVAELGACGVRLDEPILDALAETHLDVLDTTAPAILRALGELTTALNALSAAPAQPASQPFASARPAAAPHAIELPPSLATPRSIEAPQRPSLRSSG